MLKKFSIFFLLLLALVACKKKQNIDKNWIPIQNNYTFFGDTITDTLTYIWEGDVFGNVIHGDGVLLGYYNDELIQRNKKSAYWGSIDTKDIVTLPNNDQYIGKILESKFLDDFGVLIKSNGEVYIGNFKESQPNGFLTLYKDDKVYYKGEWKNGVFDGLGILYKEDGDSKTGIWKNGSLSQTNAIVKNNQGTYSGGILDNYSHGFGELQYINGGFYKGFWSKSKWNGQGYFITSQHDSIAGTWQNGKLEGTGVFKSSLFLYKGNWKDNKPNGYGEIRYSDSTFYVGDWDKGEKSGYGEVLYSNADSYFGEWLKDEQNGQGRYYYNNGDQYNGEWQDGLQQGKGVYTAKDFQYLGNWEKGWINGKGKITFLSGDYYEGDFIENKKQGIGYYHFNNGNFYEGEFSDDIINGLGVFQFADGSYYEGNFINGKIAGDGTLYFHDETESVAITAFWDGTNSFPNQASVLFSNGDLYEGELINGQPTENGTWSTEEDRLKGKNVIDHLITANEFYKKHRDTWNKVVITANLVLTTAEIATASTGALAPIAGIIHGLNVALNTVDASIAIASTGIDILEAKQNGEDTTEAYATLAKEVSVNAALVLVPKVLQKSATPALKNATRNVSSVIATKNVITFTKNKSFAKIITVTKDSKNGLKTVLNNSSTKLLERIGYKRFTENPIVNGKLLANKVFKTGEFGYIARSDNLGRLVNVKAKPLNLTKREGRLSHTYNTPGKLEGDHAGHMIGDRFGGSPELDNLVSQKGSVNLSDFKKIENQWAKAIGSGKKVEIEIDIKYEGNNTRPSKFIVKYKIDGKSYKKEILN